MAEAFSWPEPAWMTEIPEAERNECRLRFNLALAALYANKRGSIMQFSEALGMQTTALSVAKSRAKLGAETALKIEQALGRDLFPWEMFLPALVLTAA
jgi:hypothetical protein